MLPEYGWRIRARHARARSTRLGCLPARKLSIAETPLPPPGRRLRIAAVFECEHVRRGATAARCAICSLRHRSYHFATRPNRRFAGGFEPVSRTSYSAVIRLRPLIVDGDIRLEYLGTVVSAPQDRSPGYRRMRGLLRIKRFRRGRGSSPSARGRSPSGAHVVAAGNGSTGSRSMTDAPIAPPVRAPASTAILGSRNHRFSNT